MLAAFLEALPVAFGTVLATLPLVSVSLLLADRPDMNAYLAFLAGWIFGAVFVGGLAIAVSDLSTQGQNPPARWVIWLRLAVGLGLIVLAVRKFRTRAAPGAERPKWMSALQQMKPLRTFGIGAGLAVLNPKNAALFVSGALIISAETYAPVSQFLAMVAFATVSSIGLALPLGLLLMLGSRAELVMKRFNDFLTRYSAMILAVVLAVLGIIVVAGALADL